MTDKPESRNNVLRLATRRDRASDVPRMRRAGNVVLANELQAPLAALIRTLQRLGLQRITGADDPSPRLTQLIARGRDLAAELQSVVDEIVGVTGPEPDGAERTQQETIRFGELVDSVRTIVAGSIDLERLEIQREPDIAITTHPARFADLLADVLLVASNETDGPLTVAARATRSDIEVVVTWSDDVERDHDRAPEELPALLRSRTLARSLGGVLHATTIERETNVVVVLPQQRARDRRPPDGPDRPIA